MKMCDLTTVHKVDSMVESFQVISNQKHHCALQINLFPSVMANSILMLLFYYFCIQIFNRYAKHDKKQYN